MQCDERHPSCWNCTKLRLNCGFLNGVHDELARARKPRSSSPPATLNSSFLQYDSLSKSKQIFNTVNILPETPSKATYPPINMKHMRLFHHFCTVTSETLIFGPQLWIEKVVPCALKVMPISYVVSCSILYYASKIQDLRTSLTNNTARVPNARDAVHGSVTFTTPPASRKS